jgi:Domain of unknown function (DUF927)
MLKQFYEKALPSQGVYCACGIDPTTGKTTSRFAETLDDLFKNIELLKTKKVNVYVTPASYDGWSRKADNCLFVRSFFIDIDTHGKKSYGTKEETIQALNNLLLATGLPEPVYIDSGGGIHAYWIMDRDIPYEEWKPLAEKFKNLCLKHIIIDPSVTSDAARLMRCPDTINYRYDPLRTACVVSDDIHVYDLDEFKDFLATQNVGADQDVLAKVKKGLDEDTLAMKKMDNVDWVFQKIAIRSLEGDGCQQIKFLLENQQDAPRDQWAGGLTIAVHCVDGATAIHDMSNEYDKYDPKETEKTARSFGGPRTCEWFTNNFPEHCEGCKHRGKINTPLVLGKTIKEATEETSIPNTQESVRETQSTKTIPVFPDYLKPFFRGENGGVYYQPPPDVDKKGNVKYKNPVEILAHVLYPTRRLFSQLDGECMTMHLVLPNDGLKEFLLPMKSVFIEMELKKVLAFHQVIYTPKYILNIQEYLVKWSQYMINIGKAHEMRMQLGWTEERASEKWDKRGFVVGETEITFKGETIEAPISPYIRGIAKHFKKIGTYERWQESANQLNRKGFELHAMTCLAGFGTTLMSYTSTPGVVISLLGRSGSAKTGAMNAGISAFGDPKALSVFESTDNGLTGRMLALKNLMFGVDEVGNKDPKPLSQLVHNVSNGKAKIRMQASVNAERVTEMIASLIAVLTTNESVYNKFEILKGSPDGEAARLIEFLLEQPDDLKGADGAKLGVEIFDAFNYNYGHAGPVFINKVYAVGDAHIQMRIGHWINRYLTDTGGDSAYRFHQNFVAAVFTAGELAIEAGIVNYDLERIYQKVIKELIHIKLNVSKLNNTDYAAILNDFMNENMGNTLRIRDGKVTDEPRGKLVARVATDEPTRVSKEAFKEYLTKRKISPREFEKAMMESGDMIDKAAKKHLETTWKPTTTTKAGYVYLFKNNLDVTAESDH